MPDDNTEHTSIYVRQDSGWKKVSTTVYGSYLVFPVSGTEAEIAAVSELSIWWAWAILALLVVVILVLLGLLVRKIVKSHQTKRNQTDTSGTAAPTQAPRKKKKWWIILLIALLLIGLIVAGVLLLLHHSEAPAYRALAELNEQEELTMHVSVQAALGDNDTSTELALQRKTEDGHTVTYLDTGDIPLYYTDGMLILENGTTYDIGDSCPDYAALLGKLLPLYNDLDITSDGDTYSVTASGETAQEIIQLLLPQASGNLVNTQQLTAQLTLADQAITDLQVSAQGVLEDSDQTAFSLTATMENIEDQASFDIPQAVLDAANDKDAAKLPAMTDDLMNLMTAWYQWYQQDTHLAQVSLTANCGPVVVNDQLELSTADLDGKTVYCIRKNGLSIYWSDGQLLNQDGSTVTENQQSPEDLAQLLDIAYLVCQDGTFTTTQQYGTTLYTMELSGDSMEKIAEIIAPDAAKLGPELIGGTLTVHVTDGTLSGISFDLGGSVTIATFGADVSITGQMDFQDGDVTIPEAVQKAIR